jgi:uncharacterized zinc-type alcohol dehydrogenase-like protein
VAGVPIRAFAAIAKGRDLQPFVYEPGPLGPSDVEIAVQYCGVSYTDVENLDDRSGVTVYPFVPGHEVVGTIRSVGTEVDASREGQRVGVGWQSGSCMECEWCIRGEEHFCPLQRATCHRNHGGFAELVRVDDRFAFEIPGSLSSAGAAPLLCAGLTVYAPLAKLIRAPRTSVGIVGIGGLGHLALEFASAMACRVTAFSTTSSKEEDARRFGAHEFFARADHGTAGSLDAILVTVPVDLEWDEYLRLLRPGGTLHFVGVVPGEVSLRVRSLMRGGQSIGASNIGSRASMREMLAFAAEHGIEAEAEVAPLEAVNEALRRVRAGDVRYRMVLRCAEGTP